MKEHCRLSDSEQNCSCSREPLHDGVCWCTDCFISHYFAGVPPVPKVSCLAGPLGGEGHCTCYRELGHTGHCWCIHCMVTHRYEGDR